MKAQTRKKLVEPKQEEYNNPKIEALFNLPLPVPLLDEDFDTIEELVG